MNIVSFTTISSLLSAACLSLFVIGYNIDNSSDFHCVNSISVDIVNESSQKNETIYNIPKHDEAINMRFGTPSNVAICGHTVVNEYITTSQSAYSSQVDNNNMTEYDVFGLPSKIIADDYSQVLVHIASDNLASSNQMNEILKWPNSFISPVGCHVEYNTSIECLKLTTQYWMIMALSDVIISPTATLNTVKSGFPRSAAIYGLKSNALRDPNNCNKFLPRNKYSHIHQGNWFCNATSDLIVT